MTVHAEYQVAYNWAVAAQKALIAATKAAFPPGMGIMVHKLDGTVITGTISVKGYHDKPGRLCIRDDDTGRSRAFFPLEDKYEVLHAPRSKALSRSANAPAGEQL